MTSAGTAPTIAVEELHSREAATTACWFEGGSTPEAATPSVRLKPPPFGATKKVVIVRDH